MTVDPKLVDDLKGILTQIQEAACPGGDGFQKQKKVRGRPPTRRGVSGGAKSGEEVTALGAALAGLDIEGDNINSVLKALTTIMMAHLEDQNRIKEEQERRFDEIEARVREQGDHLDEIHQRGMKGNLMISSPTNGGKSSLLKTPQQLEKEGMSVTDHVRDLIRRKYKVDVPVADIQACHHVPSRGKGKGAAVEYRSVVLRIWNRTQGSAWSTLLDGIMRGGEKEVNIYANFQLTKQRSELLYQLRKLKSEKKIFKFFSNENGQLCYRKSDQSEKVKVTFVSLAKNSNPITLSVSELLDRFK